MNSTFCLQNSGKIAKIHVSNQIELLNEKEALTAISREKKIGKVEIEKNLFHEKISF